MSHPNPRICVVGATNVDLIARVPRLPALGETIPARSFHLDCGGKGANQAVMARALGARVALVTRIGRDVFGDRAIDNYEARGVDTAFVVRDAAQPTGVACILVDADGRNAIAYVPGANHALSPDDIRAARDAIASAGAVVCQLEVPLEATAEALRIAKEIRGPVTVFNPAPAQPVSPGLLRLCDVIVANEVEAEAITGAAVQTIDGAGSAAGRLLDGGASSAVITLGARGAVVVDRDGATHLSGIAVAAVDSTGAGDAFIGTLAYFLARGETLRRAAWFGNVAGALSVTKPGTQASFPSAAELDRFAGGLERGL